MANNKKKKPADADVQITAKPERKPTKKEKKAMAEAHNQEMAKKRKSIYGATIAIALLAVLLSFWSGQYAGEPVYELMQVVCYGLMGISGAGFIAGSRYEVTERQKNGKKNMGLVVMALSIGFMLVEVVAMMK